MTRRVICISRILGAGGGEIGHLVADSLGYRYVDEDIVQRAAQDEGVSVEELTDVERRGSMLDRLLKGMAHSGGGDVYMVGYSPSPVLDSYNDPKSLRALIQKAIHETADEGNVVIVSHAASLALAGRDDVLRVLVTASPAVRADRAVAAGADAKKAAKAVADDDAGRAEYLKRFYGVRAELPTHYDLVLNSDVLPLDLLADLVVRAASHQPV